MAKIMIEASVVVQCIKELFGNVILSEYGSSPIILGQIQVPVEVPESVVKKGPSPWAFSHMWETRMSSLFLALDWLSSG